MSLTAELGRPLSPQHRSSSPQAPTLQPNLTTSFLSPPLQRAVGGGASLPPQSRVSPQSKAPLVCSYTHLPGCLPPIYYLSII